MYQDVVQDVGMEESGARGVERLDGLGVDMV
jgi:hypothetical protein